jgi:hypothetical protein
VAEGPYTRVYWRGVRVNARTRDAILYAEKKWRKKYPTKTIELTQGSYSTSVPASGSTHSGGGVVDIRTRNLSTDCRIALVRALKDAGAAAWYRDEAEGFSPHIHACFHADKEMSTSAKGQCVSWDNGRNGLRNNAPDPTYRPDPPVRFSYAQGKPVPR